MTKTIRVLIALAFALFAISAIFFFSEQKGSASHSESGRVAAGVAEMITSSSNSKYSDYDIKLLTRALDYPIRKLAHLFIYFCLGLVLYVSAVFIQKDKRKPIYILVCLFIVIIVATADEINQFFTDGRGASAEDVLIDTVGGAMGIYFYYIVKDFVGHVKDLVWKKAGKADTSNQS